MFHAQFRPIFLATALVGTAAMFVLAKAVSPLFYSMGILLVPFVYFGLVDMLQRRQAIRKNYPLLGRMRYLLESVRPEIQQYFVESDIDGRPYNRDERSNIYQRAKNQLNTRPFGTKLNVYEEGYEWINHSMSPVDHHHTELPRVMVGGADCTQPYHASLFNISAMSYGSLSKNAVLALNNGAKMGGFYHNTGEGGISKFHLEHGGDLVWQVGTGYFGCRTDDGNFSAELFEQRATQPSVRMIEVKLSQGAKPGHGGILPKEKITPEIAEIRNVGMDKDVNSPPYHKAFNTPKGLLEFVANLRKLSGGKPVGFKLCVGNDHEFLAICKAMLETGIKPDFITVDGSEGGTGAAPYEFADSIGTPLTEGLVFVHNALIGCGLRDGIKIIAAGKVSTGFHIIRTLALGADMCNSARGMMFALGCIQALQCHANTCPTGVATQDPYLVEGLDPAHKAVRVHQYHRETVKHMMEILGAAGLDSVDDLTPDHIYRRLSHEKISTLGRLYRYIAPGSLLSQPKTLPRHLQRSWSMASADSFLPQSVPELVAV